MMELAAYLPDDWRRALDSAVQAESFLRLGTFLETEYAEQRIFPPLKKMRS